MVYAHAAYGFGAIYLEFGFIQLLWIWIKNLRNRDSVIEKFQLNKCDRSTVTILQLHFGIWEICNLWRTLFQLRNGNMK